MAGTHGELPLLCPALRATRATTHVPDRRSFTAAPPGPSAARAAIQRAAPCAADWECPRAERPKGKRPTER